MRLPFGSEVEIAPCPRQKEQLQARVDHWDGLTAVWYRAVTVPQWQRATYSMTESILASMRGRGPAFYNAAPTGTSQHVPVAILRYAGTARRPPSDLIRRSLQNDHHARS